MKWLQQANDIRAVVLDIDGVLTDGRIGFGREAPIKFFDAHDEHALKMALRTDLMVGVLSGRDDAANRAWAAELPLSFAYFGEKSKPVAFDRLLADQKVAAAACLYVGDDVVDIPLLRRAGVGICVADAVPEVRPWADWQTTRKGGRGAVREVLVHLLRARGQWQESMQRYVT